MVGTDFVPTFIMQKPKSYTKRRGDTGMKKRIRMMILLILIAILAVSGMIFMSGMMDISKAGQEEKTIRQIVNETANGSDTKSVDWHKALQTLYGENNDLVGYLQWDSGIISQPVVQGETNDTYLRKSFYGKYSTTGTVFLDSDMSLDDQNFVIYGHNVYVDHSAMFTPLLTLEDQDKYEQNSTLALYTLDGAKLYQMIGIYEITYNEFQTAAYQEKYSFQRTEFYDDADAQAWIDYVKDHSMIQSLYEAQPGDKFMCLQLCKPYHHDTRVVVVCKQYREFRWGEN